MKKTAVLLAVLLCLAGCAKKDEVRPAEVINVNELIRKTKKAGNSTHIDRDKKETVYVTCDSYGKPVRTEVDVVLRNLSPSPVRDVTDLTDIRNTESDEPFTLDDGRLVFEGRGEDIHYRGLSTGELPLTVSVTYYLNDREVKAEELKGASGRVMIRFDYRNNTSANKNGFDLPYPFVALTAVMLDPEVFSNITVENGRLLEYEDSKVALIMAAPGLVEALQLKNYELTKETEPRNYGTISADVSNFTLEYTATVVTSGILDELDDEDIDDLEEFATRTADFNKESKKLTDSTSKLSEAAEKLESGLRSYTLSVETLAQGLDGLAEGATGLKQGLQQLEQALAADPDNKALALQVTALRQAAEQLEAGSKQLNKGAEQLVKAAPSLEDGAKAMKKAGKDFDKAIKDFVKNDLNDLSKLGGRNLQNVTDRLKALKELEKEYGCFTGLMAGAQGETVFILETTAVK